MIHVPIIICFVFTQDESFKVDAFNVHDHTGVLGRMNGKENCYCVLLNSSI
jgi:hypothetical protein